WPARTLLCPKRDRRIDARCAPRRRPARDRRDTAEQERDARIRRWIETRNAEQHRLEKPARHPGTDESERRADGGERQRAADDAADDASRRRAERDADADLAGALAHRAGDDAVE